MDTRINLPKIAAPVATAGTESAASNGSVRIAIARACTLGVAALGALVLAGWSSESAWPAMLGSQFAMAPNTALSFVLVGTALYVNVTCHQSTALRSLSALCALGAALMGGLTAAQYALGIDLQIDAILATDLQGLVRTNHPLRMAGLTTTIWQRLDL